MFITHTKKSAYRTNWISMCVNSSTGTKTYRHGQKRHNNNKNVTCHVSEVTCQVSHVTCQILYVMCSSTRSLKFKRLGRHQRLQVTGDRWQATHDMWNVTCYMWHVTPNMWHLTCDTWHVTPDMWLMKCDRWHFSRWWTCNGKGLLPLGIPRLFYIAVVNLQTLHGPAPPPYPKKKVTQDTWHVTCDT